MPGMSSPSNPLTPLQQNYLDLQAAIASGVQEVRFQDRTVRYASPKDMMLAATWAYQQLLGTGQGIPVLNADGTVTFITGGHRQIRFYTGKGL